MGGTQEVEMATFLIIVCMNYSCHYEFRPFAGKAHVGRKVNGIVLAEIYVSNRPFQRRFIYTKGNTENESKG